MIYLYFVFLRKYKKNYGVNVLVFLELWFVIFIIVQLSFYVYGCVDSFELFIVLFVYYLYVLIKIYFQNVNDKIFMLFF